METNNGLTTTAPPLWSILMCGVERRMDKSGAKVFHDISDQITEKFAPVELIYLTDNKYMTVGQKRNHLLNIASGKYISFVDDDDHVFKTYVSDICDVLIENPGAEIVTFIVNVSINGNPYKKCYYDINYRKDRNLPDRYERLPNHIMVIKRDIARQAGFPLKSFGEDAEFSQRVKRIVGNKLINQVKINKVLYYYDFDQQITETQ